MTLEEIDSVAALLLKGGVVAYPTEAVMGLGSDPFNQAAVKRICDLKGRALDQGLLLIAADFSQVAPFLDLTAVPSSTMTRILATWPGPHTWVFPRSDRVPKWITGDQDGVAVRVTAHAGAAALCRTFGGALVSTSANPHGAPPARDASEVEQYFGNRMDAILDAPIGNSVHPSRIVDALSGQVLRA